MNMIVTSIVVLISWVSPIPGWAQPHPEEPPRPLARSSPAAPAQATALTDAVTSAARENAGHLTPDQSPAGTRRSCGKRTALAATIGSRGRDGGRSRPARRDGRQRLDRQNPVHLCRCRCDRWARPWLRGMPLTDLNEAGRRRRTRVARRGCCRLVPSAEPDSLVVRVELKERAAAPPCDRLTTSWRLTSLIAWPHRRSVSRRRKDE